MRKFFKGWRRKIGLITLLMTCFAMAGWVRSRHIYDRLWYNFPDANHLIYSHQKCLLWQCERPSSRNSLHMNRTGIGWLSLYAADPSLPISHNEFSGYDVNSQWRWSGFHVGSWTFIHVDRGIDEGIFRLAPSFDHLAVWTIPYWSLVFPLTALSTFLLISKPKPSIQKKSLEPVQDHGGGATS